MSDKHPAWTRHDLLKQLALVMPPETRQMSPEEAQGLLLSLAEEALSGRTGECPRMTVRDRSSPGLMAGQWHDGLRQTSAWKDRD